MSSMNAPLLHYAEKADFVFATFFFDPREALLFVELVPENIACENRTDKLPAIVNIKLANLRGPSSPLPSIHEVLCLEFTAL
jgi:hypothetical protein